MTTQSEIERVAVVGTGVIGASWAALYLARGFDVTATDPAPHAEENLRRFVETAWKDLTLLGLTPGASADRLTFTPDVRKAVEGVGFIQESGPEREEIKIRLFAEMDSAAPADSIIASSTSGLKMSVIQSACEHPERCVVGHPFNPPHLIPLVEVVGGAKTSPEIIRRVLSFYSSIGKKPIHLKKEVVGHFANRLQAALYREVVHLIEQGVVDVQDADAAVCWGPGLRWGIMGPSMLFHLGGGEGGMRHFLEHLSGAFTTWWKDLGTLTEFTPRTKQAIINGVTEETGTRTIEELARERNSMLIDLLAIRTGGAGSGGTMPRNT